MAKHITVQVVQSKPVRHTPQTIGIFKIGTGEFKKQKQIKSEPKWYERTTTPLK